MKVATRPLAEVTEEAITLLSERLGLADTIRFLNQFTLGHGDYTEERKTLFAKCGLDEIVSAVSESPGRYEAGEGDAP